MTHSDPKTVPYSYTCVLNTALCFMASNAELWPLNIGYTASQPVHGPTCLLLGSAWEAALPWSPWLAQGLYHGRGDSFAAV